MSQRTAILVAAAVLFVVAAGFGGYAISHSRHVTTSEDADRARARTREAALADADQLARQQVEVARQRGRAEGRRSGRARGAKDGTAAGRQEAAQGNTGPTPVPPPKLPTDLAGGEGSGNFVERPDQIVVGNHEVLEDISWSSWGGDTASATATLSGVDCVPNCAEGHPTHDSVTLEATDPTFNPNDVRYYSKLTVHGAPDGDFDIDVPMG
jgi:hypothetical protein